MIDFMSKIRFPVAVTSEDQAQLEQWKSAHGTPQQVALSLPHCPGSDRWRAEQGDCGSSEVSRPTVNLWRKRVCDLGIGQVWEIAPGRGRLPALCALAGGRMDSPPIGSGGTSARISPQPLDFRR